ncbi:MAG: AAA family ATPase [Alphaproteobacteria bacterium]|nr:AAA family ATPase [Alphaproteobacteria bacterium]
MIVEIFGPPAAGKTTLSRLLAERLRNHGLGVDLALSYRPAEVRSKGASGRRLEIPTVARRLVRPAVETLVTARHLYGDSPEANLAKTLLGLMPPVNAVWAIRLRQYIWRLTHSWNRARTSDRIVIFDQAFVQALCSLVLLGAPKNANRLAQALDLIPRADLLVRVEAHTEILRARLQKRERRQGVLERMLELNLETNLRSIEIIDDLERLLLDRDAVMVGVPSADDASRDVILDQLARTTAERFGIMAARV